MIFVLGGEGFVGSAYARLLRELDAPFIAVTRANYGSLRGSACSVLINANGNSRKFVATRDPLRDFDASVRSVAASLEDFKAQRYVFLSSGDVYPDTSSAEATREDAPIDPTRVSRYGLHKYLAEQLVRSVHPAWLVVRMGGFVGPGLKKNAVFDMLTGDPVWLSPESELQFISTDGAARLVWALVQSGVRREVVNLGAEGLLNLGAFHRAIGSASAFKPGAPTVRYELSLERLRRLSGTPLPRTADCVTEFAMGVRAGHIPLAEKNRRMLVTSRTPLRVSFFGGGTDYPEYFRRARGAVVGMAIDRYVYIAALRLSNTLDYRYRLSYSRVETVKAASDIQHPLVRTALQHFEISEPLDISVMADLPARSGLGSSSSFAVGFINLLAGIRRRQITKLDLARQAVFVERELLRENAGVQDQYHAAFGGLNRFDFEGERTRISPVQMTGECLTALTGSLFLIYTGVTRFASATLDEQMQKTRSGKVDRDLSHLLLLTGQAVDVLEGSDPDRMLKDFGAMLHEGWETKKRLSSKVSNPAIDTMYEAARAAGAVGGKLCGAGSGGFLLMLVPPERQSRFEECFAASGLIRVGIDTIGSTILTS